MDDTDWNLFDDLIVRPEISFFCNEIENGNPMELKEIEIPDHVCILFPLNIIYQFPFIFERPRFKQITFFIHPIIHLEL